MPEENIYKKIEQQGEILQELLVQNKKTQQTLNWLRIMGVIRIIIIVTPIILGIIYLPAFVRKIIAHYQGIVPGFENIQQNTLDI